MLGGITGAVKTIFHAIFFIKKWVCLEKRIMRSQGDFTAVQLEGVCSRYYLMPWRLKSTSHESEQVNKDQNTRSAFSGGYKSIFQSSF